MTITVKSLEELLVDGANVGPVVLAVANGKAPADQVQAALYEWRDALLRDKAAEIKESFDDHAAKVQEAEAARTATIEEASEKLSAAGQRIAELEGQVEALNTTETLTQ